MFFFSEKQLVQPLPGKEVRLAHCALRARERRRVNGHQRWGRCEFLLVASLFLVARPGAPSSVLAPSSDALCS